MKAWTTYYMQEDIPGSRSELEEKIVAGGFRPIDIDAGKSESHGWAYYGDGEPIAAPLDLDKVFVTPAIVLARRTEEISVPYSVWQRELKKRIADLGREVTKDEETALGDDVRTLLRKRALPEVSAVRVLVNPTERRIYIGQCPAAHRDLVVERLAELGISGVIQSPFAAGALSGQSDIDVAAVRDSRLYPATFTEV